jgi:hypothetical protein
VIEMVCRLDRTPKDISGMGYTTIKCDTNDEAVILQNELNDYFETEDIGWEAHNLDEIGKVGLYVTPKFNPNKMHMLLLNGFGLGKGR